MTITCCVPHHRGPSALGDRRRPRHHRGERFPVDPVPPAVTIGGTPGAARVRLASCADRRSCPAGSTAATTPVRVDERRRRDGVRRRRRAARHRAPPGRQPGLRRCRQPLRHLQRLARASRRRCRDLPRPARRHARAVRDATCRTRRRWRSTATGASARVQPVRRQRLPRRRADGASTVVATDLGVACGLAFGADGDAVRRRSIRLDPSRREASATEISRRCRRASPRSISRSVPTATST